MAVTALAFAFQDMFGTPLALTFIPAYSFDYPWMFVTSMFLHASVDHIFLNMLALLFFGSYLERVVGSRAFLCIYFVSGMIGNVGYMVTTNNPYVPALGASGAIYGIVGTLAVLTPRLTVFVYGVLPLPMMAFATLYGLLDFAGLPSPSGIAHGAHLGGLVVGLGFGLYLRRGFRNALV